MGKTDITKQVVVISSLVVTILFFALIIQSIISASSSACAISSHQINSNDSSNFLPTSTSRTLTPVGEGISSATIKTPNQTWLEFDGVNDYVNLEGEDTYNFDGLDGFTLSAWIKTSKPNGVTQSIFNKRNVSSQTNGGYALSLDNTASYLKFDISNGTATRLTKSYPLSLNNGSWHMVSVVVNRSGNFSLFVDGIFGGSTATLDISSFIDDNIGTTFPLIIGAERTNSGISQAWFNGSIDKVLIINRTLTDYEIMDIYKQDTIKYQYSLNKTLLSSTIYPIYVKNISTIYGVINKSFSRSNNGGNTWVSLYNITNTSRKIFETSSGNFILGHDRTGNISVSYGGDNNWTEVAVGFECGLNSTLWNIDEDNYGNLYLGEYTIGSYNNYCANIFKSVNGGLSWDIIYNSTEQGWKNRHIHSIKADKNTNTIYATQGDSDLNLTNTRFFKSEDNGTTWTTIQSGNQIYQYTTILISDDGCRILGTDVANNKIYKTCNDINFSLVYQFPTRFQGDLWNMEKNNNFIVATTTSARDDISCSLMVISPNNGTDWYSSECFTSNKIFDGFQDLSNFDNNNFAYFVGRNSTGDFTYKFNIQNQLENNKYLIGYLNSNNGTIAYDSSGNNNHGTISGATWNTDGVLNTLTEGVDYTLNKATGVLVLSADYVYNWIEGSWVYFNTNSYNLCSQTTSEIEGVYGLALTALISFLVVGATIIGIGWFISYLKPMFSKKEGLASLTD